MVVPSLSYYWPQVVIGARAAATELGVQLVVASVPDAIAAGIGPLGMGTRPNELARQQAAASVGQGVLLSAYDRAFGRHGHTIGLVLLTVDDVELLLGNRKATPLGEVYEYAPGWGRLSDEDEAAITEIMSASAPRGRS